MNTIKLKGLDDDEQYQNITYLTDGGMGEIYTALDVVNNNKVAIKVIRVNDSSDKVLLEEEFKIATTLEHPNIIKSFYYGEFSDVTGNYFYNVMEYLGGGSLRAKLSNASTSIPWDKCLSYIMDLLNGLQEAHKKIIHRDLKPENILIDANGTLKLCDFGIAKYVDMLTRTKTNKGSGTVPYMSPECWLYETNSRQMDIYSLGIIFYEILTLKRPFNGPMEWDYRNQHLTHPVPLVSDTRTDLPFFIPEFIQKMTDKNVNTRYKTVTEIMLSLEKQLQSSKLLSFDIQSVIVNANKKINLEDSANLEKIRKDQETNEKYRILNTSIDQIFSKFVNVAEAINTHSQREKIKINKFPIPGNPFASTLRLHYFEKILTVSFDNVDMDGYVKGKKSEHIEWQQRHYGFIFQDRTPDYVERDNVRLIGKSTISVSRNGRQFGFNLVLLKHNEQDLYGTWWVCKFIDNAVFRNVVENFYYAIDTPNFFKEYDYGRGNVSHVRSMNFNQLDDQEIVNLISLMPHFEG